MSETVAADRVRTGRSTAYHLLIVMVIALVVGNANFEFTLISGAFANIAVEFRTTQVALTMTVVFVASLVFLPIAGKLADIHGKKKILLAVSVLFALGSVLCALAPEYWLFLVGRVLQSSFVVAYVAGYGLVRDLLPARLVPLGVGCIGAGTGVAVLAGPLLGGYLIDKFGFRSAFWFELGYDLLAGLLVLVAVPETTVRIRRRLDVLGGLLLGFGVAALVYGVVDLPMLPAGIGAGVVLLVLFAVVERRRAEPLLSMRLLGRPDVWLTLLAAGMAIFAVTAGPVLLAELVRIPHVPGVAERGLGWTALEYGVYVGLPFGFAGAVTGLLAGWVCHRFAPRTALLTAVLATIAGEVIALLPAGNAGLAVLIAVLQGIGLGFLYTAANNLVIEAVAADSQGVATSMLYTALGLMNAVCTAVIGVITAHHTVPGPGGSAELIISDAGFGISFLVLLGTSLAALVLTLVMRHGRTPASGGAVSDGQSAVPQPA